MSLKFESLQSTNTSSVCSSGMSFMKHVNVGDRSDLDDSD